MFNILFSTSFNRGNRSKNTLYHDLILKIVYKNINLIIENFFVELLLEIDIICVPESLLSC